MIKKKLQPGGKVKPATKKITGRAMGPEIGAFDTMLKKAKGGDAQAKADLALERAKLKTFGEGPGAGASGGWPTPKKKMGGKVVKKAQSGTSLGMKSVKAGYDNNKGVTRADFVSIGKGKAKSGAAVKKCKYGCK